MAFASTTIWRIWSTGAASNGGGFRSDATGMDYSQQTAAEHTFTDMVIDGATNTIFTSAARPGVAADVGNIINVTSGTGFTVQRVQIVSVSSGSYTVDKSLGTLGSTGGNGKLGGAVAAFSDISALAVAGNIIAIKKTAGYTLGSSAYTTSAAGTAAAPISVIGYETTLGDDAQVTITAGDTTPTSILNIAHAFWTVRNLILDAADIVETCLTLGGTDCHAENVTAKQWIETGIRATAANAFVQDCWATDGTGGGGMGSGQRAGFSATAAGALFERCVTSASVSNGFMVATGVVADVRDSVAYSLTQSGGVGGHGLAAAGTGSLRAINCTFADLGGSGVYAAASGAMADAVAQNCLFSDIDRYGFESASSDYSDLSHFARRFKNNAFYSCTLGRQDTNFPAGVDEVLLTASPFVDLATGDLDLNNTPNGGRECRAAGIPGTLLGLSLVAGGMDIGALQSIGGGTGHQTMLDLWRELTSEFSTTRIPNSAADKYLQLSLERFNDVTGYNYADDTSTTLVASTQEYDIPEDALELVWVELGGARLDKGDVEEWDSKGRDWRRETATTPQQWAIYGNKLVLRPKPDAGAAAQTLTIRYIRSPRDIGTYGPEQLAPAHYRTVVRGAVAEFSGAHPDSATAQARLNTFEGLFGQCATSAAEFYLRRRMARSAPSEILTPSGSKRK